MPDVFEWSIWGMGSWSPDGCGGHWYMSTSSYQLVDLRRKAEKAFTATGKWQVVHHHEHGVRCSAPSVCEVLGIPRVEVLRDPYRAS